jgi:hypothetical protein
MPALVVVKLFEVYVVFPDTVPPPVVVKTAEPVHELLL